MNQPEAVGPYRIVAPIARGGMGVVFRAHDLRVGRDVALKLLRAGATPAAAKRLLREARALAQLRHPNVVQVHDAGDSPLGPYLALELIEGSTLDERLHQGPLPPDEVVAIGAALADALQACHDAGILHRDLKPANVLIDPEGRPRLTDFGLALQSASSLSRLSQTGAILGTPGFFAPEQARGQLDALDARADVYGLGATLYALLTGVPPVQGSTLAEVVVATEVREIPPPSTLQPGISPALDAAILRALARDPADRFASAAAFGAALRGNAAPTSSGVKRGLLGLVALGLCAALTAAVIGGGSRPAPGPAATTAAPSPPAPSPPAPRAAPTLPFAPPPLGARGRLRFRFEMLYKDDTVTQVLLLELVADDVEVTATGPRPTLRGEVSRVWGRISDRLNDLRFDSDRPDQTTASARLIVADALGLLGRRVQTTFTHNGPETTVRGLPRQIRLASARFSPAKLVAQRMRAAQACFPVPVDGERWTRTAKVETQGLGPLTLLGEVRVHCRRAGTAEAPDYTFTARLEDARWRDPTPPLTALRLEGRARIRRGRVTACRQQLSGSGRGAAGLFEFASKTEYELEYRR